MIAGVAELVDARHSKCRSQKECRFDSDRPHQSTHRRDKDASRRRAGASHRALFYELDALTSLRNTIITFRPASPALHLGTLRARRGTSNQIDALHIVRMDLQPSAGTQNRPTCCICSKPTWCISAISRATMDPVEQTVCSNWLEPGFENRPGRSTPQDRRRCQDGAFDA